jgi:alkanesulfonate monooxygenase SsuD/methylene tetrahydromethanopterin reductase-like flavin-dependent oxidoreductase (luciferase family)
MDHGVGSTGESLRPVWPHADALITRDCRSLRFAGKYADVVALSTGDPTALRPTIDAATRRRVATRCPNRDATRHCCCTPTISWRSPARFFGLDREGYTALADTIGPICTCPNSTDYLSTYVDLRDV